MPSRVLIVSHLFPSRSRPTRAPWLAEQVRAVAEAGVEVEVLCCSPFDASYSDEMHVGDRMVPCRFLSTSAGPLNGRRAGLVISTARYAWHLWRFLGRHRGHYDVLHAHFAFPDGMLASLLGRRADVPVVVTVHGSDVAQVLARDTWLGRRVSAALGSTARVICVSAELETVTKAALPPGTATSLISNGYDDALFLLADKPRDLGLLFVGSLRAEKNILPLVEVYLADSRLHDRPLSIVGSGPLRKVIEERAAASPASGSIRLLGELSRDCVADAMQRATALIVPSSREGYGVVAAEALACGTPVVATRVGGLPHILAEPSAGIVIDPGDPVALADALHKIVSWPHTAEEVAAGSGALPWRARALEITQVYSDVVGTAGGVR